MVLTTSIEWNDRFSSNCHLGHSIKKRDTGRQEGPVAEKAVPSSIPLFDAEPLVASNRRRGPGRKCGREMFEDVQQLKRKWSPS